MHKHKDLLVEHVSPSLRLMNEYKTLLVKLHVDATIWKPKNIARKCYNGLMDVQIVAGLACKLPILRVVSSLMKADQSIDVFVSDYLAAVKTLHVDLAQMYLDQKHSSHNLLSGISMLWSMPGMTQFPCGGSPAQIPWT
jgi:hypothetical protein